MSRRPDMKIVAMALAIGAVMCFGSCFAAALVVAGLNARESTEARAISKVLQADSLTASGVADKTAVVANMKAIDLSDCPDDFRFAYEEHIRAWESAAEVEVAAQDWAARYGGGTITGQDLLDIVDVPPDLPPEATALRLEIVSAYGVAQDEIAATFDFAARIAKRYGAKLP